MTAYVVLREAVTRLAVFGNLTVLEGPQFEGAVILKLSDG